MKSDRPRSVRSWTKAKLIEEIERLRERLARAERSNREASSPEEAGRLRRQLAEALEQQTATSEILRVIASSPTDAQPVFDVIARNAVALCDGFFSVVGVSDGRLVHLRASHNLPEEWANQVRAAYPLPLSSEVGTATVIREQRVLHFLDAQKDVPDAASRQRARTAGYRTWLGVPLLGSGGAIGVLAVARREKAAFTDTQIALLQTFADQAVIAIENVRLFNETKEALDQQTATADILRVISRSPTDTQPVFDAIAESAARLCSANDAQVLRVEGDILRLVAAYGATSMPSVRQLTRGHLVGRSVIDRRTIHVRDLAQALAEYSETTAARYGVQSALAVPLLRDGVALGVIRISRTEIQPFTDKQIALLQTFADQAAIAIENVRLFKELEARNHELTEALDRQTATAEILRVISSSPTDTQPVFDAIARSASRLLGGAGIALTHVREGLLHRVADYYEDERPTDAVNRYRKTYPRPLDHPSPPAMVVRTGQMFSSPDTQNDPRVAPAIRENAVATGYRRLVIMPMLRDGKGIGAIHASRAEAGWFSEAEVALLQTFADQAVIAIENVRLFTELQEKNRALSVAHAQVSESLEQQTATSEILRVISSSPTDVQPVFDAIAESAARLCSANDAQVLRVEGDSLRLVATCGATTMPPVRQLTRGHMVGHAVIDGRTIHVRDRAQFLAEYPETTAVRYGTQSAVAVPLLRDGVALGVIRVSRMEMLPFTDSQIALLQTFADQAVIAIENVRLFTELQASNRDLTTALDKQTATSDILRVISRSPTDVQPVFDAIVVSALRLLRAYSGTLSRIEGDQLVLVALTSTDVLGDAAIRAGFPQSLQSEFLHAQVIRGRAPINIADAATDPRLPEAQHTRARVRGYRSLVGVPLFRTDEVIGVISVSRRTPGGFTDDEIALLKTFADQAVIAIENVRLFKELEAANRELAAASQHKSEFLANMSHELRTPLNAIIGFSEVLSEKMFGELNEKQEEYSKDIHASGQHLLSLINDILDLSKIEAGRMELELSDFHLPTALDSALTLVRERAGRRSIVLHLSVDERLGQIQADERKVRQVVLNLLSNAIKFTPEGGRIEISAVPRDGSVEVAVRDTGVGIAPEDQEAVFEEFRQVGTADKKAEGTGLGLTLCRKFIELHGGKIWVKSQPGAGSTFTFTIPVRPGQ